MTCHHTASNPHTSYRPAIACCRCYSTRSSKHMTAPSSRVTGHRPNNTRSSRPAGPKSSTASTTIHPPTPSMPRRISRAGAFHGRSLARRTMSRIWPSSTISPGTCWPWPRACTFVFAGAVTGTATMTWPTRNSMTSSTLS